MRNLINVAIVILTKAWCTFYNIINFIYCCLWKLCHCFVIYRCAENSGLCSHWSINNISQCFESEPSPFFGTHTNTTSHFVSISNLTDVLAITVALRWLAGHSSDQSNILSDSQCRAYSSKSTEVVWVSTEHRPSLSFIFFLNPHGKSSCVLCLRWVYCLVVAPPTSEHKYVHAYVYMYHVWPQRKIQKLLTE